MKIAKLTANWYGHSEGDDYDEYEVGKKDVIEITEHKARGDGDKWFYDIVYANGIMRRIFNPDKVIYLPKETTDAE